MDPEFEKALRAVVKLWVDTGREGQPTVRFPIDKIEGLLGYLDALIVERDAALFQMRANAEKLDHA